MAKGDDTKLDNNFGTAMVMVFFSGIGTIIGALYHLILKHIFSRKDTDLTLGFRKNPKLFRVPAMAIALVLFSLLVYGLYRLSFKLVPAYDQAMNKLFIPVEEELKKLDELRREG